MAINKLIPRVLVSLIGLAFVTSLVFAQSLSTASPTEPALANVKTYAQIHNNHKVDVSGAKIESISGSTITALTSWGAYTLRWLVNTDSSTRFVRRFYGIASLDEFSPGDYISFHGLLDITNSNSAIPTVKAKLVRNLSLQNLSIQKRNTNFIGTISAIDPTTNRLTLTTTNVGSQIVYINNSTITTKAASNDLQVGDRIKVQGSWDRANNTIRAQSIKVLPPLQPTITPLSQPQLTGVKGQVEFGGCTAVSLDKPSSSCFSRPYVTVVDIFDESGKKLISKVKTDAKARFHLTLEPGTYTLIAEYPNPDDTLTQLIMGWPVPQKVTVKAGVFTEVELKIDNGMRTPASNSDSATVTSESPRITAIEPKKVGNQIFVSVKFTQPVSPVIIEKSTCRGGNCVATPATVTTPATVIAPTNPAQLVTQTDLLLTEQSQLEGVTEINFTLGLYGINKFLGSFKFRYNPIYNFVAPIK